MTRQDVREIWERTQPVRQRLATWPAKRWFQMIVATLLTLAHLFAFAHAGKTRLGIPFDLAPGAHLEFADPNADALGPVPRQPAKWSRLVVSRYDTQHYVSFALRGLSSCPTDPTQPDVARGYLNCSLGWLPAYGVVGGLVSDATGLEPDVALTLVSVLSAIMLNFLWLCPTMVSRIGRFETYALVIAWNCYPGAWSLVAPVTESLTLVIGIGAFIMLCKQRWWWASFLVGASTAFRIPTAGFAFAMGCALLLAAYEQRKVGAKRWWMPILAASLCGWGQFLEMAVFQWKLHNWHAFFDARFAFGDKSRWDRLIDVTYYLRGFQSQCGDMIVFMSVITMTVLGARRALAGFKRVEGLFLIISSVFTVVVSIMGASQYWGITRYMMLCPLAFMSAANVAKRHRVLFVMWLLFCVSIYWHFELCNYVTQGDRAACPVLGRMELSMPWKS